MLHFYNIKTVLFKKGALGFSNPEVIGNPGKSSFSRAVGRKLVSVGRAVNKKWPSGHSCFVKKFTCEKEGIGEQYLKGA